MERYAPKHKPKIMPNVLDYPAPPFTGVILLEQLDMNAQIKAGTWWKYIGPGDGKGVNHKVTSVADGEVTTWSDPHAPRSNGWSWLGTVDEFFKSFRPVPNAESSDLR